MEKKYQITKSDVDLSINDDFLETEIYEETLEPESIPPYY